MAQNGHLGSYKVHRGACSLRKQHTHLLPDNSPISGVQQKLSSTFRPTPAFTLLSLASRKGDTLQPHQQKGRVSSAYLGFYSYPQEGSSMNAGGLRPLSPSKRVGAASALPCPPCGAHRRPAQTARACVRTKSTSEHSDRRACDAVGLNAGLNNARLSLFLKDQLTP
eukprot:1149909-Pelagomonas_calceolata.AAC.4